MHMQEIISSTGILTLDAFALRLLILCTPHSLLEHFHTALLPSSTSLVTIDLDTFGRSRGLLSSLGAGLGFQSSFPISRLFPRFLLCGFISPRRIIPAIIPPEVISCRSMNRFIGSYMRRSRSCYAAHSGSQAQRLLGVL